MKNTQNAYANSTQGEHKKSQAEFNTLDQKMIGNTTTTASYKETIENTICSREDYPRKGQESLGPAVSQRTVPFNYSLMEAADVVMDQDLWNENVSVGIV